MSPVKGAPDEVPDPPPDRAPRAGAITDVQVVQWLLSHPDFFEVHADVLADIRLRHPQRGRAISLIERQILVLRDRNQALEASMADLIRIGQENDAIALRLGAFTQDLLSVRDGAQLPTVLLEGLRTGFGVPQVALRLWGIQSLGSPHGDEVTPGLRRKAGELQKPYCGPNSHPEPAAWLETAGEATGSMALLALRGGKSPKRSGSGPAPFGLLVLGSPDPARFQAGMGTAFLERIAEIAGASLSRLLCP